jgi:hypothetical protein
LGRPSEQAAENRKTTSVNGLATCRRKAAACCRQVGAGGLLMKAVGLFHEKALWPKVGATRG